MAEHPHHGHRKRLKNQYVVSGYEGMSDFTLLELILFYSIPQGDTNVLAHRLIEKFGSLDRVFEASYGELLNVDGVGEHTAIYLTLYQSAMKRYADIKTTDPFKITDESEIESFVRSKYINVHSERAMILHFSASGHFVNYTWLGNGNLESVRFDSRAIAASILENNTKAVIVVHNHPSGIAAPSDGDLKALKSMSDILKMLHVRLYDNMIITDNSTLFFSKNQKLIEFLLTGL